MCCANVENDLALLDAEIPKSEPESEFLIGFWFITSELVFNSFNELSSTSRSIEASSVIEIISELESETVEIVFSAISVALTEAKQRNKIKIIEIRNRNFFKLFTQSPYLINYIMVYI